MKPYKTILIGSSLGVLLAMPAAAEGPKKPVAGVASLANPASLKEKAPEIFRAKFETTRGDFVIEVTSAWAPHGADRFYNLVKNGYYDGVKFFRVVPGFVAQFGIHGDPSLAMKWLRSTIPDDPVTESNRRGFVTYAKTSEPNSRSVQLFINLRDNAQLDAAGFSPFGQVVEGMDVVDQLYSGFGDNLTGIQGQIASQGNAFLDKSYPQLDSIKKAVVLE